MRFLHPETAWWFAALLAVGIALRALARRRLGLATASPWVFDPRYRASLIRRAPALIFLIAWSLLGCALMDPVVPFAETDVQSHTASISSSPSIFPPAWTNR